MEKIAVIGLACLFPGAKTPEMFWQNLMGQKDLRSLATDVQLGVNAKVFYDPQKGKADTYYCIKGGYIHDFKLDPTGFQVSPESLKGLDDLFQWSLYVAREALRDSGYWGNADVLARCGIILGNLSMPTKSSNHLFLPMYHHTVESCLRRLLEDEEFTLAPFSPPKKVSHGNGRISGYPAALIAQALSLSGVCFSLDAACASSLYSVKAACDYLLCRKADLMLAGAVSAADPFFVNMGFSVFQVLPQEGMDSCPLDKSSAGMVAGEGAGMFVLKRYRDALKDGDRVYAIIRGIGLSNDGRGQSVLSPNPKGQIIAFERAYADADTDPKDIAYVECHATGTPLGDKVELNSMDTFLGEHGAAPLVGSVKSNLGHLLTAAGMPSMIKVILSMAEGMIPATINVRERQGSTNHVIAPNMILNSSTPWPHDQSPRVAAVSAFGLGGTNAHLIFSEEIKETTSDAHKVRDPSGRKNPEAACTMSPIAIVGMDALFGSCRGLSEFHRCTYEGTQQFIPLPPDRWKGIEDHWQLLQEYGFEGGKVPQGAYVTSFDLDFLRCRIPPDKDDPLTPQQLAVLKVADNALREAQIEEGQNVAVIIAMETELALHQFRGRANLTSQLDETFSRGNGSLSSAQEAELQDIVKDSVYNAVQVNQCTSFIGNIMASRVSSLWDFSGPSFTLSSEETSMYRALEVAQMLLESGEVEAVVVGAVDLAGGVESVLWRNQRHKVNTGHHALSFDQHVNGWMVGEGAGAVVLKRLDMAKQDGSRIYATIDAVGFEKGISGESIAGACHQAFAAADIQPSDVAYCEVSGSGVAAEDEAEMTGLIQAYKPSGQDLECAIGSVKSNIGHTFAASGMASLIKTALCLYHRYIPKSPGWRAPKLPEKWGQSPFYVPSESRPWFLKDNHHKRTAAISGVGQDGTCTHLILSEEPAQKKRPNNYLAETPFSLFPIAGDDLLTLQKGLDVLEQTIDAGTSLSNAAGQCLEHYQQHPRARYTLAIVGHDKKGLIQEIAAARTGMEEAFSKGEDWGSLQGSYFTADPLGTQGKVAFVYPGGFTSYRGLGRDIFQLFPELYEQAGTYTSSLGQMIGERLLYPRGMRELSKEALKSLSAELINSPIVMFESSMMWSLLFTHIVRGCFRIEPHLALGYSMGEVSMLYALGVWDKTDEMGTALATSPVFQTRLAGPMETIRHAWNLPRARHKDDKIWHCYTLKASVSDARRVLEDESRAYLIIINTPDEVVIAGQEQACKRVIQKLNCEYSAVPISDVIHCEMARPEYEALANLHRLPVNEVKGIDFYSAVDFAPLRIDTEAIASNIADLYCRQIDFPELIQQAYKDGARIFLELGPRQSCTKWIGEILRRERHLAVGINGKGIDDKISIIRALAKLFSHRVPLDLSPLYARPEVKVSPGRELIKSISPGGVRIGSAILTKENKERFRSSPTPPVFKTLPGPSRPESSPAELLQDGKGATGPSNLDLIPQAFQKFDQNLSLISSAHSAFLQARREGLKQIGEMIQLHAKMAAQGVLSRSSSPKMSETPGSSFPTEATRRPARSPEVIWDKADLQEFAGGNIADVFGEEYAIIDSYRRRVRLPTEPYLLVSRVTKLDAERGVFRPSSLTTEYDIPQHAWFSIDGQIAWAVAVESGQCDLLLISYLGIDFECKGDRVYRLLDCTLTFLEELPKEGQTLRFDITINSFARSGSNLLFFFSYECFVGDKMVLKMDGGCAGFFSDKELESGRGIIPSENELEERSSIQKQHFDPLLTCDKSTFERSDLLQIIHGNVAACFGAPYDQRGLNPSLRFATEQMLMFDRVVSVDPKGGAWGLGLMVAEKILAPDHWYFPCHFKDDQVLAGSLMAEGCGQLLQFYLLFLGLQTCTRDARFQPIPHLPQRVRCRGQVTPKDSLLTYRMEIKEIGTAPKPYAIANVDILLGDKTVVDFKDLGVQLCEKPRRPVDQDTGS